MNRIEDLGSLYLRDNEALTFRTELYFCFAQLKNLPLLPRSRLVELQFRAVAYCWGIISWPIQAENKTRYLLCT